MPELSRRLYRANTNTTPPARCARAASARV